VAQFSVNGSFTLDGLWTDEHKLTFRPLVAGHFPRSYLMISLEPRRRQQELAIYSNRSTFKTEISIRNPWEALNRDERRNCFHHTYATSMGKIIACHPHVKTCIIHNSRLSMSNSMIMTIHVYLTCRGRRFLRAWYKLNDSSARVV
jgi:hypothetical protein